jgi:hypothetical protein
VVGTNRLGSSRWKNKDVIGPVTEPCLYDERVDASNVPRYTIQNCERSFRMQQVTLTSYVKARISLWLLMVLLSVNRVAQR